jgi:hypothetical protein
MTDIASALAASPGTLSQFDGRDVLRTTIAITKAGDGLSEAMAIDPQEFHHAERVFVVLECTVDKVRFDPIKDTQALTRVHVLSAGLSTIVDEDVVRSVLDTQAERIEEARLAAERAAGIHRLPFGGDKGAWDADEETLALAHGEGEHVELVDGCPLCQQERDAAAAGD